MRNNALAGIGLAILILLALFLYVPGLAAQEERILHVQASIPGVVVTVSDRLIVATDITNDLGQAVLSLPLSKKKWLPFSACWPDGHCDYWAGVRRAGRLYLRRMTGSQAGGYR